MSVNILTTQDLQDFKSELLSEVRSVLKAGFAPPKKWLKSDELKKILKVSQGTLQTLRDNGTLQYTKLGGLIYYDFEHLEKILKQNLHTAKS